ncbi:MAG: XTP/dITP diphosphatase [Lachnospira sp.]|nr:XTP/dITP diphosphatase [Lachnospira sp.]
MKKIIFASNNEGKIKEVKQICSDMNVEIISMKEAGIELDIEENGTTFEENALIKAEAIMKVTGQITIADDSGLEVDYLGGEPGVYSARYMGHDTPYDIKNQAIIDRLKGVEEKDRTARFVCAMAAVFPDGRHFTTRGTMEGIIGYEIKGSNGFGYDPIVYLPQYQKTSAELSPEEKNKISHRGEALEKLKNQLTEYISL